MIWLKNVDRSSTAIRNTKYEYICSKYFWIWASEFMMRKTFSNTFLINFTYSIVLSTVYSWQQFDHRFYFVAFKLLFTVQVLLVWLIFLTSCNIRRVQSVWSADHGGSGLGTDERTEGRHALCHVTLSLERITWHGACWTKRKVSLVVEVNGIFLKRWFVVVTPD